MAGPRMAQMARGRHRLVSFSVAGRRGPPWPALAWRRGHEDDTDWFRLVSPDMDTPPVLARFAADCRAALADESPRAAVHELMRRLLAAPEDLAAIVPSFDAAEVATSERGWRLGGEHVIEQATDLTVMVLDTLPGVEQPPHEHNMAAFIGVFEGAEEQRFWAKSGGGLASTPGRTLAAGDVMALGEAAVHAISAPAGRPARAIHVYLGDIYAIDRSVFDPDTLEAYPMTSDRYDQFCRAATA